MTVPSDEINVHKFLLAKRGTERVECEDAIALNTSRLLFAVADGATEAYDSRSWAKLLVRSWVRIDPPAFEMQDFEPLVRDLGIRLQRKWSRRNLPWYADEKAQSGSFAAFVGLHLFPQGNGLGWRALALGDCCLIVRLHNEVSKTFPVGKFDEFSWNPVLLPSLASKQYKALQTLRYAEGASGPGTNFFLLSDAAAAWFLKQTERKRGDDVAAFDRVIESDDPTSITEFFEGLRDSSEIRNDDVAVLKISVH